MKISKFLLYVLLISLFAGSALSFTTPYVSNTTWNILESTNSHSHFADNMIDQKTHEFILNTLEEQDKTKEEAEDKINEAEVTIAEVEDKIDEAKTNGVSSETIDEAEGKLEAAEEDLAEAKDKLETGDYDEAYQKAESCRNKGEDALDMLGQSEDDEDDETGEDDEADEQEKTKEEAESKIKEAEDKIKEVEDKLAQAKNEDSTDDDETTEDDDDDETTEDDDDDEVETSEDDDYKEAKEELEGAKEELQSAKDEFAKGNYNDAYMKAEKSIEKCENALDMLEGDGGSDSGDDDGPADPGNGDETGDESPEQEEIVVIVPDAIKAIETPQMIAFTAIGAIAVSNIILLTNKRFALKSIALVIKLGDAFVAVSAVAFKIGGTLFVVIGAVLRPPSIRNIKQDEVLTNATREQIYEYICTHEGAHFREIINHADIGPFAGIWHLQVLEDFGFIVSRRYMHYKIYYPTGRKIPVIDPRLVLKTETAKAVFRFISKNPGTYQNEIAKELGKAHGTIRYNLKKLVSAKIVEVTTDNGRKKFFINENLTDLRDLT